MLDKRRGGCNLYGLLDCWGKTERDVPPLVGRGGQQAEDFPIKTTRAHVGGFSYWLEGLISTQR